MFPSKIPDTPEEVAELIRYYITQTRMPATLIIMSTDLKKKFEQWSYGFATDNECTSIMGLPVMEVDNPNVFEIYTKHRSTSANLHDESESSREGN